MKNKQESFEVPEPRAYPRHPRRPESMVRREFIAYSIAAPKDEGVLLPQDPRGARPAPGSRRLK